MSSEVPAIAGVEEVPRVGMPGEVADPAARPVLRREGLYQSQVREWMVARDAVAHGGVATRRPHRATAGSAGGKDDSVRLAAENERLRSELVKSQAVVEIMGKLQGLLESVCESPDTPPLPRRR